MNIHLPELSLLLLIGTSGSGKSSFARKHFKPTEVVSSDYCRALVSDEENNQTVSTEAFDLLHTITAKRLALGNMTVIDATNVQPESRKALLKIAKQFHVLPVAIVFKLPVRLCLDRNALRPDRQFGPHVVRRQNDDLRRSLFQFKREGFHAIHELNSEAEVDAVTLTREPMWTRRVDAHGPFDIIGDVHGCHSELLALLGKLGYDAAGHHPDGRTLVFLGDLVDRGDRVPEVLSLVMDAVERGDALCVPGNHDMKLLRKLNGRDVQITHGLAESLAQLAQHPPEFHARVRTFLDGLVSHYVLDGGKLVVAHAGMKTEMMGRGSSAVREFALFGETTGETDEFGLPVRYNWAADYRGRAMVVYGHTPVPQPEWLNGTINIDTGCVFGGALTALRYPEGELVRVPALRTYAEPVRPLITVPSAETLSVQQQFDDVLEIDGVLGKKYFIQTGLLRNIIIAHENAVTALEVISRFTINPKWLIHLPPTMAPTESHRATPGFLEHPREAFAHFAKEGVARVVCEEKHMGSRAIVIVGRDEDAIRRRFGIVNEGSGVVYTRTGRRFFDDTRIEQAFITRMRNALTNAGWWAQFKSDWLCLDCELMPWSAKAQGLLKEQYAAVGAAAQMALRAAVGQLQQTQDRQGADVSALLAAYTARAASADRFVEAYRRYCWPVTELADYKLAPFHLLASEGEVHVNKDHEWHMRTLAALCDADPGVLRKTQLQTVTLADADSVAQGVDWWLRMTESGGEGMVVKPFDFISRGEKGLVQPGLKVRGREYLRIIYGPEYDEPQHLARLRVRSVIGKRRLALREFALGVEALERFVRREPLSRVHECVFGVLALESEPIDPRL